MNEFLEAALGIRLDAQTALWLAVGGAIAAFVVFMTLHALWSRLRSAPVETVAAETTLLDDYKIGKIPKRLSERLDARFAALVTDTGLGLTVEQTIGWIVLAGAVGAVGMYVARPDIGLAVVGLLLGFGLTFLALASYQSQQRWRIREQLPEIFYMLARSTRAGLSVERAIELLGRERKVLLAPEFRRVTTRIELGMPAVVALNLMAKRLGMLDFDGLVALIALHQNSGGNLPTLLERLASGTREHNQFRNYVRTATALGRTSALCIGLATPVILLAYAIVQPEFCQNFFHSTYGWTMVAAALGLDLVGGLWLFYLLRIEY